MTKKLKQIKRKKRTTSKNKRKKRNNKLPTLFWLLSLGIILLIFFISMFMISEPVEEKKQVEQNPHKTFIETLAPHAQQLNREKGILPSIMIGQAILESDWGQSELGAKYHNLFGRKAYGDENKVRLLTKEFVDDKWIEIEADFKVYSDWNASMDDHAQLLENGVTWNPELYREALQASDYAEAAKALQAAGYATDPTYAEKVIGVIETNKLYEYDK